MEADPTAALIIQKQAQFSREFSRTRSTTFAATVANRFFSDNSLGRQRRLVECTKRRQARAREKRLERTHELRQLQEEYEQKQRVSELKSERETSRMRRKLEHVAASYIQHVFRQRKQRWRTRQVQLQAAQCIADFISEYWRYRQTSRQAAALSIQRCWRSYDARKRRAMAARVLQRFIRSLLGARRERQLRSVRTIQHWYRNRRHYLYGMSAAILQRAWRCFQLRVCLRRVASTTQRLRQQIGADQAASVLQKVFLRFACKQKLIRNMYRQDQDHEQSMQRLRGAAACHHLRQSVTAALERAKRLQFEETKLQEEVSALRRRLRDVQDKCTDEKERLRRFHAWADVRQAKAEAQLRVQLSEWAARKRLEIRMELERELELERRAQLRVRQQLMTRPRDDDSRIEVR